MIALTASDVRLGARAASKEEAIRAVGAILHEGGFIEPGYVESMLGRELQANTYLSQGIAIPHGMGQHRDLIRRTGIAVLQLPEGVEWNGDQRVHLVVGIAAKSDEHLSVLAALTDLLDDEALAARLAATANAQEIVDALTRRAEPVLPGAGEGLPSSRDAGATTEVRIRGEAGLHARPATALVEVASRFAADIDVEYNGRHGNAKALASLLKLGAAGGATLRLTASGDDANAALRAVVAAIEGGLGEAAHEEKKRVETEAWTPASGGRAIDGLPASPGLAIGPVRQFQPTRIVVTDETSDDPEEEVRRLEGALEAAHEQLEELYASVKERTGKEEAAIFRAHQALLRDEELARAVKRTIAAGHGAAWSWHRELEQRAHELGQNENERLAARAADLRDVGNRVLRLLAETVHAPADLASGEDGAAPSASEPAILIADDLTPSDTARLDPKRILGVCTASGGPTSHTAIIARSLDIPAVVGAGTGVLELPDGAILIVDGTAGRIYTEPSAADLASAQVHRTRLDELRDEEAARRYEPAYLTDGHRVEVAANIGKPAEAQRAVEAGAEGVGLLRTEFLFLDRDRAPTEDEQFAAYSEMTRALNGLPLVIRTLDIGGDKRLPYLPLPHEENPFLGVRGIRLCLRRPELFEPQLRAIYRASRTGPVKIMFPMIATLEDLREGKAVAERIRAEVGAGPVDIGIMVEVPSAVVIAPELAREADFFSIGTNDLTQYVLAIDRMHPTLGTQADALHPAVLRMIDMTVRAAAPAGKWVGVCGGMAGDPVGALILTGLGVTELSMSIPSIAAVKATMRRYSLAQARAFAARALACSTAREVRELPLP